MDSLYSAATWEGLEGVCLIEVLLHFKKLVCKQTIYYILT